MTEPFPPVSMLMSLGNGSVDVDKYASLSSFFGLLPELFQKKGAESKISLLWQLSIILIRRVIISPTYNPGIVFDENEKSQGSSPNGVLRLMAEVLIGGL